MNRGQLGKGLRRLPKNTFVPLSYSDEGLQSGLVGSSPKRTFFEIILLLETLELG
jgi:hypothetical protein